MDIVGISQKEQVHSYYSFSFCVCVSRCLSFSHMLKISVIFQDAIFRVVASILHLGNVEFTKGKEADTSVLKDEKSKFHLETVAELLMYDD